MAFYVQVSIGDFDRDLLQNQPQNPKQNSHNMKATFNCHFLLFHACCDAAKLE